MLSVTDWDRAVLDVVARHSGIACYQIAAELRAAFLLRRPQLVRELRPSQLRNYVARQTRNALDRLARDERIACSSAVAIADDERPRRLWFVALGDAAAGAAR